jgi:hypothetical protein
MRGGFGRPSFFQVQYDAFFLMSGREVGASHGTLFSARRAAVV